MSDTSTVLRQSYKIYNELRLVESFGECGKARAAWRMAAVLRTQGKDEDADRYGAEAEEIRVRRGGGPAKDECDEADFNALLNYMDS
jgi:hypothetical protein